MAITLTPLPPLPSTEQGAPAAFGPFVAIGGVGPYTYAITAGGFPTGLTLNADGTVSGTATASGNFDFTVEATDSTAATGNQDYPDTVVDEPTITVLPAPPLPATGVGKPAGFGPFTATGGTGPYTFTLTGGALPQGLTLNSDGTLSGTANLVGSFSFEITATDSLGDSGYQDYSSVLVIAQTFFSLRSVPPFFPSTCLTEGRKIQTANIRWDLTKIGIPFYLPWLSGSWLEQDVTLSLYNLTPTAVQGILISAVGVLPGQYLAVDDGTGCPILLEPIPDSPVGTIYARLSLFVSSDATLKVYLVDTNDPPFVQAFLPVVNVSLTNFDVGSFAPGTGHVSGGGSGPPP